MRKKLITLFALAACMCAPMAFAAHFSDLYVIPVASHISGVNGTVFISDLSIQNFQSTPLTVTVLFIESGEGNAENVGNLVSTALPNGSVTVPAGGTVILRDVLSGYQGKTTALVGSLIVSGDKPFAVTSRNYSVNAAGGTIGQTVPPARDFVENAIGDTINAMATSYLPGLISNAAYRTNVGFTAAAGQAGAIIEIEIKDADGTSLGKRSFYIGPNLYEHVQVAVTTIASKGFDAGSATLRITNGDAAVAPYASVVDNISSDAVFITGVFPPNAPFAKVASSPSRFRQLVDRLAKP
ncbi:MAG TPA: hypothetical protein VHL58_05750 [Thermoanaerobaculia bacterium]|nr:hypothetical protein [Thermoanaerobaculia bacterium]